MNSLMMLPAASTTLLPSPTVFRSGTGSGTVTSGPAGISCGPTCTASYDSGTVVTLTASAAGGTTLSGRRGSSSSGPGASTLTKNAAALVTADFSPPQFTLTGTKAG